MDSQYQAWNGETYQWPPPEGWEKRSDGQFWPPDQGSAVQETTTPSPPPAPVAPLASATEPTSLLPERSGPKSPQFGDNGPSEATKGPNKAILIVLALTGILVIGIVLFAVALMFAGSSSGRDGGVGAIGDVSLDQSTCVINEDSASVTMFVDNTADVMSDYLIEVTFTAGAGRVGTHESRLDGVLPKNRATITVTSDDPLSGAELSCQVTAATRKPSE